MLTAANVLAEADLIGQVTDEDGKPVAGVKLMIYEAIPRHGQADRAAARYPDCDKETLSQDDGSFVFQGLDSELKFRVLASKASMRSVIADFDPISGSAKIVLRPKPTSFVAARTFYGRVVDQDGKAIVGASIQTNSAANTRKRWGGRIDNVDRLVVSDADGRFVVTSAVDFLALGFEIHSRNHAAMNTERLGLQQNADDPPHEIVMRSGITLTGRFVQDRVPVAGVPFGVVQVDRSSSTFVGPTLRASDENGSFRIENLPENQELCIFSIVKERNAKTFKTKKTFVGASGTTMKLGDLELIPGVLFSGRVELPEGMKLVPNARLRLSREPAWDWKDVNLADDGSFVIHGLPPEVYKVRLRVDGVKIDSDRFRFQMLGDNQFGINLKKDQSDFVIPTRR